jgi:tRNA pseudouridine38-40 synthase
VRGFRLTLEYDGSRFHGWQVQPGGRRTVQGVLEEALRRVGGGAGRALGAGRTDAGVHAEGQVAGVWLATELDPAQLARALNGLLPPDLAVVACEPAPEGFHPRYAARAKLYCYRIWNGACRSPLRQARVHWVRTPLDLRAMREAAALLVGTHDFAAFQAAGSDVATTLRTLARVDVSGVAGGDVAIEVVGDGFLRHMVRILAGTLIDVGLGRRAAASMPALLAGRDRSRAGRTAPAQALTLVRVEYDSAGTTGAWKGSGVDGRGPLRYQFAPANPRQEDPSR